MIKKLFVANRGEIAVRVIRAAREMGIRTVAGYSEADRHSLHPALADEAVGIGGAAPSESYLNVEGIIAAAKVCGADAIHPGYGFLSEQAEFADACSGAGLIFVGPPASAMRLLGNKIASKQLAVSAGVPITPGFFEPDAGPDALKSAAGTIGYPIMLKASAGGGGRGMRVVRADKDFDHELAMASEEALKAFGDGSMMVEKLVERPRHVEAQILADTHGNVAVLFERECSMQRRHQKLIEESPGPMFRDSQWQAMRSAVVNLVRASGYENAGTVEFLMDQASGDLYFMEVNARLQVEHPVTEAVTGVDLVQWQLRIASGERLVLPDAIMAGDRSALYGHAIEARVIAENPAQGFMPSVGRIKAWAEPKMPGVRIDTGYGPGAEVSRYYDSLLAKVIAHGETRGQATRRLIAALEDFHILGVHTNIAYLLDVLRHPSFEAGSFDTGFLEREFGSWDGSGVLPPELGQIAACAGSAGSAATGASVEDVSAWSAGDGFRVANCRRL